MNEEEYQDLLSLLAELRMTPAQLRVFCEAAMLVVTASENDNVIRVLDAADRLVGTVSPEQE